MAVAPQELTQGLLQSVFKDLVGITGEPGRQPRDFVGPLFLSENFDGRHASGFSPVIVIQPHEVGMDDTKFKTGRRGYVGQPAMDVFTVRPYRPGEQADYRLQPNPELKTENSETTYVVLTSNYRQDGDDRGVVTKSWVLRNDGVLQTWETWSKWQDVSVWGGNVTFSKIIPNNQENNLDLWNKVNAAVKKQTTSQ